MKVSIVTATYNSDSTLLDTVNSVLSQTYQDIEYIVIDGGSVDNTKDIVRQCKDKIDVFVSEPDNGIFDAYNKGIKRASGEIVALLNSDDVFSDVNVIANVVDQFKLSGADVVYGDLYYVKGKNPGQVVRYWESSEFRYGHFANGWQPPHPSFFVKKEVYFKCGFFRTDMRVSADFEFMLRVMECCRVVSSYIPVVLVRMRTGGESNASLKNIVIGNLNVLRAFDINNIKINSTLYVIRRLLSKVVQFFKR